MKKILKSILIATASIGTIAGSVATVVSCGESGPDNTKKYENQDKYNSAINKIKAHLASSPIDMLRQGVGGEESARDYIRQETIKFVEDVSTSDATKLTSDELATINVGQISVSSTTASFENLVSSPKDATATLVIPGNEGVDPSTTTITNVPVKYTVTQNNEDVFAQQDLNDLVDQFVIQFSDESSPFNVKISDTADNITHRIETILNNEISNKYSGLLSATVTGVKIGTDNKSFNTTGSEGTPGTIDLSDITVTAKPVAGLEIDPVNFVGEIKYELYSTPTQDDYEEAINGLWDFFHRGDPPSLFTLPLNATDSDIKLAIQHSILNAINDPRILQGYERDALKQNILANDITVSVGQIYKHTGTYYFGGGANFLRITIPAAYVSITPHEDTFIDTEYTFT